MVTEQVNYRYLTGFTGSRGYLLVARDKAYLFTDFRYSKQAREQTSGVNVVEVGSKWQEEILQVIRDHNIRELGLEKDTISYQLYASFKKNWTGISLSEQERLVASLREIKDGEEIEIIEKSVALADEAFAHILPELTPGRLERDIALELEYYLRKAGAERVSFDYIVASGIRGAMPHGVASDKALQAGDLVTLDFGGIYQGYCSDMTRTVALSTANPRQREIYQLVQEAQEIGVAAVSSGRSAKEVDHTAREHFASAHMAKHFGHGLGHGVGMEVHELPRLSPDSTDVLKEGMVVTVEPGLYIEGFGGVRIEDMVLVTETGCRVLTKSTKELLIL